MTQDVKAPTSQLVRLSVVLDTDLAEHVRVRAFEERLSRSAFVRRLVEKDVESSSINSALSSRVIR